MGNYNLIRATNKVRVLYEDSKIGEVCYNKSVSRTLQLGLPWTHVLVCMIQNKLMNNATAVKATYPMVQIL